VSLAAVATPGELRTYYIGKDKGIYEYNCTTDRWWSRTGNLTHSPLWNPSDSWGPGALTALGWAADAIQLRLFYFSGGLVWQAVKSGDNDVRTTELLKFVIALLLKLSSLSYILSALTQGIFFYITLISYYKINMLTNYDFSGLITRLLAKALSSFHYNMAIFFLTSVKNELS
jgi:hypothetical protein